MLLVEGCNPDVTGLQQLAHGAMVPHTHPWLQARRRGAPLCQVFVSRTFFYEEKKRWSVRWSAKSAH